MKKQDDIRNLLGKIRKLQKENHQSRQKHLILQPQEQQTHQKNL